MLPPYGYTRNHQGILHTPEGRPAVFHRGYDVFDQARVGFVTSVPEAGGRRFFRYDTSVPGNSNAGHLYGTALPDEWAGLDDLELR